MTEIKIIATDGEEYFYNNVFDNSEDIVIRTLGKKENGEPRWWVVGAINRSHIPLANEVILPTNVYGSYDSKGEARAALTALKNLIRDCETVESFKGQVPSLPTSLVAVFEMPKPIKEIAPNENH